MRATPKQYGYFNHMRRSCGDYCESTFDCATPEFYEFAQLKAPHPAHLTAHKLPPEQHTWMGRIYHVKSYVCTPYAFAIPAITFHHILSHHFSHSHRNSYSILMYACGIILIPLPLKLTIDPRFFGVSLFVCENYLRIFHSNSLGSR